MRRAWQRGASGVLFLVILLLVITALLAGYVLQRMTSATDANTYWLKTSAVWVSSIC